MSAIGDRRIIYVVDVAPQLVSALAEVLAPLSIGVRSFSGRARLVATLRSSRTSIAGIVLACDLDAPQDQKILGALAESFAGCPVVVLADRVTSEIRKDAIARGAADAVESSMIAAYIGQRILDVLDDPAELANIQPGMIALAGHANVFMRPIRREDSKREQLFMRQLNRSGVAQDFYAHNASLVALAPASQFAEEQPGPEALVAVLGEPEQEQIIGIARFVPEQNGQSASFGVATLDDWRGKGIGSQLLRGLIAYAAISGVSRLEGQVLKNNLSMLALAQQLGFDISRSTDMPDACTVSKILREDKSKNRASNNPDNEKGQRSSRGFSKALAEGFHAVISAVRSAWQYIVPGGFR